MTLFLDHQQRLNLCVVLGNQRGNTGEMRSFWKLIDRLELDGAEQEAIGYRVEIMNTGNGTVEVPRWDPDKRLDPRGFEFGDADAARLRKAIEDWPHFVTAADRRWLEPMLAQLPEQSANGNKM